MDYRVYFLDDDNHIRGVAEVTAETDEAALEEAQEYREGRALELWTGPRFAAKIPKPSREDS